MRAGRFLAAAGVMVLAVSACDRFRPEPDEPGVFDRSRGEDSSRTELTIPRTDGSQGEDQEGARAAANEQDDPVPTRGEREVEFPATAQAVTDRLFPGGLAERFESASVPVLAPAGLSEDQARTFADSYRTTPDGYFARIGFSEYDVVVNGTRAFARAPQAAEPITASQMRDYKVSESETGLSVTFSRFGADYSLDFVCRGAGEEESATCVGEQAAAEVAQSLVPVGGGGSQ